MSIVVCDIAMSRGTIARRMPPLSRGAVRERRALGAGCCQVSPRGRLLASVLRFFVVLTGCVVLIARGGEHRVALVSAAGAAYFAVVMFDAWLVARSRTATDA